MKLFQTRVLKHNNAKLDQIRILVIVESLKRRMILSIHIYIYLARQDFSLFENKMFSKGI